MKCARLLTLGQITFYMALLWQGCLKKKLVYAYQIQATLHNLIYF